MSSNGPVLAVVCDNNGTLLDDLEDLAYPSLVATFEAYGLPAPLLETFRNEIGSEFAKFYWNHGVPREARPEEINVHRLQYYKEHGLKARYRPDAELFLRECQELGMLLSIVSAEIKSLLIGQLDVSGLHEHFDDIQAEAWPKGPALQRTLDVLSRQAGVAIEPSQAVYIDDTVDGLEAAKKVGMRTIGFTNPTAYCSEERLRRLAQPDETARSFTEAGDIVRMWSTPS